LGKSPIESVIAAMSDEEKIQLVLGTGMQVPGLPENKRSPVVGEVKKHGFTERGEIANILKRSQFAQVPELNLLNTLELFG
jgi:hypothetical protein